MQRVGAVTRPHPYSSINLTKEKDTLIMLNLNSVMIGTKQSKMLADFYEKVFGKPADMIDNENGFFGWQVGSSYFSILEHSEMGGNAKDPGRVMMNFETTEVKEEFEKIKSAGAQVIREPYEMGGGWIATLADPEEIISNLSLRCNRDKTCHQ